jgi:hypothetical protein
MKFMKRTAPINYGTLMGQPKSTHTFAVCIDNNKYPSGLESHKVYTVVPD